MFFPDVPGGTVRTFHIGLLLAYIHSQCGIALVFASSRIAFFLNYIVFDIFLDGGWIVHSAIKLLLDIHFAEDPTCNTSKGSEMAKVF